MTEKHNLRKRMILLREGLSKTEQSLLSSRVIATLKQSGVLSESSVILAYLPYRGEVDLSQLFDYAQEQNKQLSFPKITDKDNGLMEPYAVGRLWRNDVIPGVFNILEPKEHLRVIDPALLDLVLIPGVAFDRSFYRLGYGGGFYDRFLPRLGPQAVKIGIAYDLQIVDRVPRDPHDIALDGICTEDGLVMKP